MKKFLIFVAVLVVLVLVAELSTPYLVSKGLQMGLNKALGTDVAVSLESYPSLRLLLGQFDSLAVVAQDVPLGGLRAVEYRVAAEKVALNLRQLLLRQELDFVETGDVTVAITVAEGELNRYLWEQVPELKNWRILINQDEVVVVGPTPLLNALLDTRITGVFAIAGSDKLAFVSKKVEVNGTVLPDSLVQAVFSGSQFHVDLTASPMPLELTAVEMIAGKVVIKAKVLD